MSNNPSLIDILSRCINSSTSSVFDGRSIRFDISNDDKKEIEPIAKLANLNHEFHLNNQCEVRIDIPYNDGKLILFYNEEDFLRRAINYFADFDQLQIVILKHDIGSLQKSTGEQFTVEKAIFFNFLYYHKILRFLERQDHFISVHSRPDLQFVIFTSEKGPFYIGYNLHEPKVKNLEDLSLVYRTLEQEFQKIDFVQFFKGATINTIHEYPINERFFYLVQSLRVILNVALRDHFIYIRNFDFDKIKTKFKEERNKYFESLEKNIDSISKQVTSFPLTFAASIFAGYQVKDKPAILVLVFLAYLLYTIIAWKILGITSFNTESTKSDVEHEEKKIKSSYEVLYHEFEPEFKKIYDKINRLEGLITILRTVLVGLLISFVVFAVYQTYFAYNKKPDPTEIRIVK